MTKRSVDATHLGNSYSPDLRGRRSFGVFTADREWWRYGNKLPSVVVTEPTIESAQLEESEALYSDPLGGRFYVLRYPEESPEPLGQNANHFANGYYYEGFYTEGDPLHAGKRIDCFRIAEILYLHALARGYMRAHVGLGNIYYHDRCEGHYFEAVERDLYSNAVLDQQTVRAKAYEHYRLGMEAGEVEACFMFGDVLRNGVGCEVDLASAFETYQRALGQCRELEGMFSAAPGCVHMRLGRAYEEGEGCTSDFVRALEHYQDAATILEKAVERADVRYDAELAFVECGVVRMKQELRLQAIL